MKKQVDEPTKLESDQLANFTANQLPKVAQQAQIVKQWMAQKAAQAAQSRIGSAVGAGLEHLGRPQAALLAGTSEALKGGSLAETLQAGKRGFQEPSTAPSGFDVVDQASDKIGLENPYLKTAAGLGVELVADPVNALLPGGSKLAQKALKGVRESEMLAKAAEVAKGSKAFGVLQNEAGSVSTKDLFAARKPINVAPEGVEYAKSLANDTGFVQNAQKEKLGTEAQTQRAQRANNATNTTTVLKAEDPADSAANKLAKVSSLDDIVVPASRRKAWDNALKDPTIRQRLQGLTEE